MADQAITVAIGNVVVGGLAQQFTYAVTIIDAATTIGVCQARHRASAPSRLMRRRRSASRRRRAPVAVRSRLHRHRDSGRRHGQRQRQPPHRDGIDQRHRVYLQGGRHQRRRHGSAQRAIGAGHSRGPAAVRGSTENFSMTATAGSTVSFAWTAGTGTLPITSYLIEAGVTPGSVLGCVSIPGAGSTFTVALPTGAFYVRLYALSGATRSAVSNEIRIFVNVPAPPSAPTNLLGLVNGSSIGLSWVNTAGGGAPAGLILDVSGSLATSVPLPVTESFSTPGVPPGTYTLTVRATNATGTSAPSNPVTLTFPGPCAGAPLTPVGFSATRSGNTISVSWMPPATGPSVASYTLAVSGAFVGSIPTTTRSLSGTVLPGSYTFSVTATNACGTSAATTPQTVTIP